MSKKVYLITGGCGFIGSCLIRELLKDDNINVIETRYNEYLNSTQKVSSFYKDKYNTKFYEIDGSLEIEEITQNIKQILKKS